MSRKILARAAVAATVTEPADELSEGPMSVHLESLDDGNVVIEISDEHGNLVVFETDARGMLRAIQSVTDANGVPCGRCGRTDVYVARSDNEMRCRDCDGFD